MDDPARTEALRALPAVGALLEAPELAPLVAEHGRSVVTRALREAIGDARKLVLAGRPAPAIDAHVIEQRLIAGRRRSLRRVVNATGVVLHTNLGRAPLAKQAREAVADAAGYCNVEMNLDEQKRGSRHDHINDLLAELLNTDGGLALNNCAGAVFAMLAALCRGGEVIVARSELVEIGGGFRVPDVMAESGAKLVEVGTTNKVYAHDYKNAITEHTKALMVVHRSNFDIIGFTHTPKVEDIAAVAQEAQLPLLVDVGSGLLAPRVSELAIVDSEPRPAEVLAAGADLVAFSGDKLLGGPQAGIVAGKQTYIDGVAKHPLARALRADKLTLAGLEATLRLYRDGRWREIPALAAMSESEHVLQQRAEALAKTVESLGTLRVEIVLEESVPGGGCLPGEVLATRVVCVGDGGSAARRLSAALARSRIPVVTRMVNDRVGFDVRTLNDHEIVDVRTALECLTAGQEGPVR